jgi:dienelactone hydrolase
MRLEVDPVDGPCDAAPAIRIHAAPAGADVVLGCSTTDTAGHRWRSDTTFTADPTGSVDVARDAPVAGGYSGPDPGGPIWSMQFLGDDPAPTAFVAPADRLTFTITARSSGVAPGTVDVTRRWAGPGVRRTTFRGEGYVPTVFHPAREGAAPAVAVVPGATGAAAVEPAAALLATHGYLAVVLAYIGEPGLPAALSEVPLEVLSAGIRETSRLSGRPCAVLCYSVGTGGVLAALAELPDLPVSGVVAVAPSNVIWQAIGADGRPPRTSSWTLRGEPLPYVPVHAERLLPEMLAHTVSRRLSRRPRPRALHLRTAYATGLKHGDAVAAAAIRAERIDAPLLLLTGEDDQMWPAASMAAALLQRRRENGTRRSDEHVSYADAGHFLRPPIIPTTVTWNDDLHSGGTPEGCAAAQADGWARICAFLRRELTGDDRG